ncbi:rCG55679 [Rattus norvegicus]|uniref:RCG55679 n=1 Tax=Rattus norvegicus TaxID=10116 RepID=A6JR78_RAT|nr:rCG55679 [Rattus norvegicus]
MPYSLQVSVPASHRRLIFVFNVAAASVILIVFLRDLLMWKAV